jgi:putative Mn2+ efflux pump MntP
LDYSAIIHASALSLSLSLDALAAAFAYGCSGTRIPVRSVVVINIVCTAILAAALFAGTYAAQFIPAGAGVIIAFTVLLIIGAVKLVQSLRSSPDCNKTETVLRPAAAAVLAACLSLDGLAAGFGAALGGVNTAVMLGVSLVAHMVAVPLGCRLGRSLSRKTRFNISWLGGVVIIVIAFTRLL